VRVLGFGFGREWKGGDAVLCCALLYPLPCDVVVPREITARNSAILGILLRAKELYGLLRLLSLAEIWLNGLNGDEMGCI
jgi:hypothetical protein